MTNTPLKMLRASSILTALALAAAATVPLPVRAGTTQAPGPGVIDAIVSNALSSGRVPGISIAIERDGKLLYAQGYGYRTIATKTPVDPATAFEIGSITKQFTAAAIGILADDGKLHFDDLVATYLPDAPHASEITIRQLLNHTSGLRDSHRPPPVFSDAATPKSIYDDIATAPLASVPGTTFAYCNTNYIILGAIVERLSGMPYAAFLQRRIVQKTPFAGITYGEPPADVFATGYRMPGEASPAPHWPMNVAFAAGGLSATASDLARWDDAFFNGRVVPKPMVAALTTPPVLTTNPQVPYAAGWWDATIDGHAEITHNGGMPGFVSVNAYFPDDHLAIVALANVSGYELDELVRDLFRAYVPATAAQRAADLQGAPGEDAAVRARVLKEWQDVASGKLDRSDYDPATSLGIPDDLVARAGAELSALGTPAAFVFAGKFTGGTGSTTYVYHVHAPNGRDMMTLSINPAGLIDGIYFKRE